MIFITIVKMTTYFHPPIVHHSVRLAKRARSLKILLSSEFQKTKFDVESFLQAMFKATGERKKNVRLLKEKKETKQEQNARSGN